MMIYAALLAPLALLVTVRIAVRRLEPKLTFRPVEEAISLSAVDSDATEYAVETEDGETIYLWHFRHPEPTAQILFFHGNHGHLALWYPLLRRIVQEGYDVAALDYRGYGKSSGTPSESGVLTDSKAFVNFYRAELQRPCSPVVYWGRSLGGLTSAYASQISEPDGLILEATFPNLRELLRHSPVLRTISFFSSYRLAPLEFLERISCPVLVVHGDADNVVPLSAGRRLYEALQGPKSFYQVAGARHGDLDQLRPAEYWGRIRSFTGGLTAYGSDLH